MGVRRFQGKQLKMAFFWDYAQSGSESLQGIDCNELGD